MSSGHVDAGQEAALASVWHHHGLIEAALGFDVAAVKVGAELRGGRPRQRFSVPRRVTVPVPSHKLRDVADLCIVDTKGLG
jgi:hypothetical protein